MVIGQRKLRDSLRSTCLKLSSCRFWSHIFWLSVCYQNRRQFPFLWVALCNCLSRQQRRNAHPIPRSAMLNEQDFLRGSLLWAEAGRVLGGRSAGRERWVTQQKVASNELLKLNKQYSRCQCHLEKEAEEAEGVWSSLLHSRAVLYGRSVYCPKIWSC